MSSWQHDPWTQDDSVLDGLPYTEEPPAPYSISGVKTVWHWSRRVLDGLPYTVAPPERWGFKAIYVGSTRVRAVYRGETLVWAVGMAWRQFASLNDYLDYYFDPARAAVWERPGFAAYISGLWALQAVLKELAQVDTNYIYYYTAKYRYEGAIYHGTYTGYVTAIQTDLIPMVRAQHFSATARIVPDDGTALYWRFYPNSTSDALTPSWRTVGTRLTGELRMETGGILTGGVYRHDAHALTMLLKTATEIPTVEAGELVRYMGTAGDPLFGDTQLVRMPTQSAAGTSYQVDRAGLSAFIRDAYNVYYLQQYPALADVIFIPPEITLGTWDDLLPLTWDDASAYTWNEIGGN